jgi:hypothetical protein
MEKLYIYKKLSNGTCGDLFKVIWASADECLAIAEKEYSDYLWAWEE